MKTGLQRGQVSKELKRAGSDKATDDKVWVVEGGKVGRWEEGGKEGSYITSPPPPTPPRAALGRQWSPSKLKMGECRMKMRKCNICQGLRNILPGICLNHRDCLLTGPGKYMYNMSSSFNAGGVVVGVVVVVVVVGQQIWRLMGDNN